MKWTKLKKRCPMNKRSSMVGHLALIILLTSNLGGRKTQVLPDVLEKDLKVVFCGTAVGDRSAARKAYYAGIGNKFYGVIHEIGLTPRKLKPDEYSSLPKYGIGLTDLVKTKHGTDRSLGNPDFNCEELSRKIETYAPKILAFNGKKAAEIFLARKVDRYGLQPEKVKDTLIFVLPSTSGAASGFWSVQEWQEMANTLKK